MIFEKYRQTLWRLALVAAMSFVLSLMFFAPVNAANYDCGAYGAGAYGEGQVCGSTSEPSTPPPTTSDGGGLINTGQALSIAIPAFMIIAGTIMLFRLNRKRKTGN